LGTPTHQVITLDFPALDNGDESKNNDNKNDGNMNLIAYLAVIINSLQIHFQPGLNVHRYTTFNEQLSTKQDDNFST
jgi:hypothetical protein